MLYKARREYGLADIVDCIRHKVIPQAVDNLVEGLEHRDKDYTQFALKHTVFRQEKEKQADAGFRTR